MRLTQGSLEYSIIQSLFEAMGYDLGRMIAANKAVNFKDLLSIDGVDFAAAQTPSASRPRYDAGGELYYSRPYLTQDYRLISRAGEEILSRDNNRQLIKDKKVGAVIGTFDAVASEAAKMFRSRFGQPIDNEYFDLKSALEAIQSGR